MKELLAERSSEDQRPVRILAQDEGRFGRINEPHRCWAPLPHRPSAPRQIVREYLYVFSAVCPAQGRMTSLILPWANTETMSLFLEHLSAEFADEFLIVVMDQAGWHLAKGLQVPENIRLILLPAYAPELNPVEHIWADLREKDLANQAFSSLDGIEDQLCRGLQRLTAHPDYLRSLTAFPYLNLTL